jgi:hypothetical protein
MQPHAQNSVIPNGAYMQSRVQYFLGKTIYAGGSGLGLLEWSKDGHIRLFAIDPSSGQSTGVVFDCVPNQIRKVRASLTHLGIYLDDKSCNMDFSNSALPWLAAGGLIGLFMANRKTKQSGIQWWVDNIRAQGVAVKQLNILKWVKISLLIVLVPLVLLGLLALLAAAGGSH